MKTHSCHQKFKVHTTDILCCHHWVLLYLPTLGHHRTFDELHKPVHLWPASHRNKVSALTQASPLSPLSLFRRIQSFLPRMVWDSGHRTSGCSYAGWWLPLGMVCFLSVAAKPSLGVWSICVLCGFCLPVVLAALWNQVSALEVLTTETNEMPFRNRWNPSPHRSIPYSWAYSWKNICVLSMYITKMLKVKRDLKF